MRFGTFSNLVPKNPDNDGQPEDGNQNQDARRREIGFIKRIPFYLAFFSFCWKPVPENNGSDKNSDNFNKGN